MSSDIAVTVNNLSKCYHIYDKPRDRLKQFLLPRIQRVAGLQRQQYFREFWALKDVSLEIKKGETIGIIGRNGSGKSTLLQMICGTLNPTSGSVKANGRIAALLELGAGFNPEFTGRENVLLHAAILGFHDETIGDRMAEVLAFSELGDFFDQPVKTYSSGMYARLAFSAAIHVDPEILIVDEALAVGDSRFVAKCMRRIKDIQERGTTLLFVSHDVGSVRTLCQRAIWLGDGQLIDDGDVFPVTSRYTEFMFSDETVTRHQLPTKPEYKFEPAGSGDEQQTATPPHLAAEVDPAASDLDVRPVTHWGSRKRLIISASICDDHGERRDVVEWGQPIEVKVDLVVPLDISREHLSVAFSIKDLKGTDLIVSTTHDTAKVPLPAVQRFTVRYRLPNLLVTGKYLLVVAVENRQYRDIEYYEYIEGAHYFASLAIQRFFGVFQPRIEQHIEV